MSGKKNFSTKFSNVYINPETEHFVDIFKFILTFRFFSPFSLSSINCIFLFLIAFNSFFVKLKFKMNPFLFQLYLNFVVNFLYLNCLNVLWILTNTSTPSHASQQIILNDILFYFQPIFFFDTVSNLSLVNCCFKLLSRLKTW